MPTGSSTRWTTTFKRLRRWHGPARRAKTSDEKWTHVTAISLYGMGLYQLMGTVKYPAQATPVRSSLSRVRENRTHGLKGVVRNGPA